MASVLPAPVQVPPGEAAATSHADRAGGMTARCGLCRGYCANGSECAVTRSPGRTWDWRSGAPEDLPAGTANPEPEVAVLIPAHNEAKGIATALEAVLGQTRVPGIILVIAHNCSDATAETARRYAGPGSPVRVAELNLDNGERKTAPLNRGMDHLLTILDDRDLIMAVDADTCLRPDLIERAVAHFTRTPRLGAVAAHHLVDSPRGLLSQLQANEMERGRRSAGRREGRRTCMSGMCSVFRVSALLQVHAKFGRIYEPWNSTEDWGLTFALRDAGWLDRRPGDLILTYTPVTTWKALSDQRERWGRGYWETLLFWKVRKFTLWPWILQAWWAVSTAAFGMLVVLNGQQHHFHLTSWLAVVTAAEITVATVTVRKAGVKAVLLAALIFPEMIYVMVINAATVKGVGKQLLHRKMQWADVRNK